QAVHLCVDVGPGPPPLDHALPAGFQSTGAELVGFGVSVQGLQDAEHVLEVGPAALVPAVVFHGPTPVGDGQFVDGESVVGGGASETTAVAQPLGDEPVVLGVAFLRAVNAKIVVLAVDPDDGLTAALVVTVGRCTCGHIAGPFP